MRMSLMVGLCCAVFALPAQAADLVVSLQNKAAQGIADAVVTFHPEGPSAQSQENTLAAQTVNQKDLDFQPFMTIVPKGGSIDFTNEDSSLHHVFSFSAVKRFSLKLFGQDETQSVTFDQPGIVVVGCNIHDDMIAYLKIVDTPHALKTDEEGQVVLKDVPDGPGVLRVWHPLMKAKNNQRRVDIADTQSADPIRLTAKFRRGARPLGDY